MSQGLIVSSYNDHDVLAHIPKGEEGDGISILNFNKGNLSLVNSKDIGKNIAFIIKHPKLDIYYAVTENIKIDSELIVFTIDGGIINIVDRQSTRGKSACYINITGVLLSITNYWDSSVVYFNLNSDGWPHFRCRILQDTSDYVKNNNPTREQHWAYRQLWSHSHCIVTEPYENNLLFIVDLGRDIISFYEKLGKSLFLRGDIILEKGTGGRHLVFHPKIKIAYLVNELNSTISVLRYNSIPKNKYVNHYSHLSKESPLFMVQNISTLPENYDNSFSINSEGVWKASSHASEIKIHPSLNYVFVSNRGHDSITLFKILKNGELQYSNNIYSGGKTPRNFNFIDDFLIVGNQDSNNLSVFLIDNDKLIPKNTLDIKSPNYLLPI